MFNKIKVKLKLIQPEFKCSGRKDITCYYRGEIINENYGWYLIKFKYKGELIKQWYRYINDEGFEKEELHNIKLITKIKDQA